MRQQRSRAAERAAEKAQPLADPGAVAIVTGQQAGLFGGPLYVLLKAVATLEVARRLEQRRGRPVVPVFWVASDDHDFAEIRSTTVLDANGTIRTLRYDPQHEPVGAPAWAILLDETIGGLRAELARVLPAAAGRDELLEAVEASLRPGRDGVRARSHGSSHACCPSSSCSTPRTRS